MLKKLILSTFVASLTAQSILAMQVITNLSSLGGYFQKATYNPNQSFDNNVKNNVFKGFITGAAVGSTIWTMAKIQEQRNNKRILSQIEQVNTHKRSLNASREVQMNAYKRGHELQLQQVQDKAYYESIRNQAWSMPTKFAFWSAVIAIPSCLTWALVHNSNAKA